MAARRTVLGGILLLSVWTGCAGQPRPVTKVEEQHPPTEQARPEEPVQPAAPPETPKSQVIVVESGGEEETSSRTLVEAAKAERERKAQAGPPVAVITNKTLPKYATGQVTVAEPKKGEPGQPAAPPGPDVKDEQYWRRQGLELRLRWRETADEVQRLEQSASEWRRRFYAQDDPYVRDGQIKPEWDRVLDRLEEARTEVEAAKQDLARFLEEGRQAGALPGWLREGVDQEPKPEAEEPPPGEPVEPTVLDEDGVKYEPSSPPPRLH